MPNSYPLSVVVNENQIQEVLIGRHYLKKHSAYMNDELILELILELISCLDGRSFQVDSASNGIDYYAADVEHGEPVKVYRLIWLLEGDTLEVLGIVNAYRRKKISKGEV